MDRFATVKIVHQTQRPFLHRLEVASDFGKEISEWDLCSTVLHICDGAILALEARGIQFQFIEEDQ